MAITSTTALAYQFSDIEYWNGSGWSTVTGYNQVTYSGPEHYWRIKPGASPYQAIIRDDDLYLNNSSAGADPNPENTAFPQTITINDGSGSTVLSQRIFSADTMAVNVKMSVDENGTANPGDDTFVDTTTDVYSVYTMAAWGGSGTAQSYFLFGGAAPVPGKIYATGGFNATSSETNTYGNDISVTNQLISNLVCFVAGTKILTEYGEIPVEELTKGDLVMTKDNGFKPIFWIGARKVNIAQQNDPQRYYPVCIAAGALGDGIPERDLYISQQHRVLVKSRIAQRMFGTDEVLVPARKLTGISGIDLVTDCDQVTYLHFLFDRHEIVYSNGAETESLYTGRQALQALTDAGRQEVLMLFPELADPDYQAPLARNVPRGKQAAQLARRHAKNGKTLFTAV